MSLVGYCLHIDMKLKVAKNLLSAVALLILLHDVLNTSIMVTRDLT
jgi:hypothetical protein